MSFVKRVNNLLSGARLLASSEPEPPQPSDQPADRSLEDEAWARTQAEASQVLGGSVPWPGPPQVLEEPAPGAFDAEFGLSPSSPPPSPPPGPPASAAFPRAGSMGPITPAPEPASSIPGPGAEPIEADALSAIPATHVSAGVEEALEQVAPEAVAEAMPAALEPGRILDLPDGSGARVLGLAQQQPGLSVYRVALEAAPSPSESPTLELEGEAPGGEARTLRLREAPVGSPTAHRLAHEAQMRGAVEIAGAPRVLAFFEAPDRAYLLDEWPQSTPTLATLAQGAGIGALEYVSVLAQVASIVARLHGAGWVHGGLRPEIIALGETVRITDFSFATPIGEAPVEAPQDVPVSAGVAAPEHLQSLPADPRADIYAVGAMLFQALNGSPLRPGSDWQAYNGPQVLAGAPQILSRCLGAPGTRYGSAEELSRDLLRLAARLRPTLASEIAAASSIGLEATRSTNQDAFSHASGAWAGEEGHVSWAMACVADGMGGMEAGEVASQAAAQSLLENATVGSAELRVGGTLSESEQAERVRDWARAANERVCQAMQERGARGGCTLVAALIINGRLSIAHVGDCRAYLWRAGQHYLLSRDHSLVMALVLQGEVSPGEVRSHPDRSMVTRSLGEKHPLPDHHVDGLDVVTGSQTLEMQAGDVLLLCSDGLWEPVDEAAMEVALREPDLNRAARLLIESALRAGAPDNATVTLVRLREVREGVVAAAGSATST